MLIKMIKVIKIKPHAHVCSWKNVFYKLLLLRVAVPVHFHKGWSCRWKGPMLAYATLCFLTAYSCKT